MRLKTALKSVHFSVRTIAEQTKRAFNSHNASTQLGARYSLHSVPITLTEFL